MTGDGDERKGGHYFNVERFREVHDKTKRRRGRLGRLLNRITWSFSSVSGIFSGLLFPVFLIFGPLLAIVGSIYLAGGWGFYGMVAAFVIVVSIVGEKRVGAAQFGDYGFVRRILAQLVAGSIVITIFLAILFLVR